MFSALRNGRTQLHLRSLDVDTAEPLNSTEEAILPFWSPDGRSIGFFANNQLKRIDLDGGLVQTLTRGVGLPQGGTWGPGGVILFSGLQTGQLFRIPASGGEPVAVTKMNSGSPHTGFRRFCPAAGNSCSMRRGRSRFEESIWAHWILLTSRGLPRLTRLAGSRRRIGAWLAVVVHQGALVARRFDPARRELEGDPVTVAESVAVALVHGAVSVSASGVIAYRTGAPIPRQLTWFDRSGRTLETLGEPDRAGQINVELSRDGLRAAVQRTNNVWIIDSTRTSPFTFSPGW